MKIYLVGGAVRDTLLQIPVKEYDWVIVGASVQDMLKLGYRQVGKDFPVFLHPKTNEEYALARTERKVGRGYTGFDFDASADVTLEDDLRRRDLTINAMAVEKDKLDEKNNFNPNDVIDYYHGTADLKQKILRHVSPAFVEDPVRVLRIARFAARYFQYGFQVTVGTNALMKQMVLSGEVDALVPERVWKELERALGEKNPDQFFIVLKNCDAFSRLFPELESSNGINKLKDAANATDDVQVRFATLLYDVPEDKVKQFCDRYRVPNQYRELAVLVTNFAASQSQEPQANQKTLEEFEKPEYRILFLFMFADAYRREERFKQFLKVCEICKIKVSPLFMDQLWQCYTDTKSINVQEFISQGITGSDLQSHIKEKRIQVIASLLKQFNKI